MQNGDRIFIGILILAAAAWIVFEFCRPGQSSGQLQAPPVADLDAVPATEQAPPYLAAPPLMAMLPTIAE